MTKTEKVNALMEQIKQPQHSLQELEQILEDYKQTVIDFVASDSAYRKALMHTHEEFPDLQRLLGRKHDAILKGRLLDAITLLKKKVTLIETPIILADTESENPIEDAVTETEKPTFRIMPNLGMD